MSGVPGRQVEGIETREGDLSRKSFSSETGRAMEISLSGKLGSVESRVGSWVQGHCGCGRLYIVMTRPSRLKWIRYGPLYSV